MFHKRGSGQISLLKYSGIIMDEKTIIFIMVGVFVCLFCFAFFSAIYYGNRTQKELSGKAGVYTGPAGEPRWDGKLPGRVDDYTAPRYVYENLVESTDYLPENGRIIGYRIAPDLVIHSRVQYNVNPPCLERYIKRLGGYLLKPDEALLLKANWGDISALRKKSGDDPLYGNKFWCSSRTGMPVCAELHENEIWLKDMIGFSKFYAPLILKR